MKEENKKKDFEEKISIIFLICFALGGGYYFAKQIDENSDFRVDLERKKYVPYEINKELYLVNEKNGKTYKLEELTLDNKIIYKYNFLAKPKSKKAKVYQNTGKYRVEYTENDPLGILPNKKIIIDKKEIGQELQKRNKENKEEWAF